MEKYSAVIVGRMTRAEMATRVTDCINELLCVAGLELANLDRFPEEIHGI
jgi:hypothetical protein